MSPAFRHGLSKSQKSPGQSVTPSPSTLRHHVCRRTQSGWWGCLCLGTSLSPPQTGDPVPSQLPGLARSIRHLPLSCLGGQGGDSHTHARRQPAWPPRKLQPFTRPLWLQGSQRPCCLRALVSSLPGSEGKKGSLDSLLSHQVLFTHPSP